MQPVLEGGVIYLERGRSAKSLQEEAAEISAKGRELPCFFGGVFGSL